MKVYYKNLDDGLFYSVGLVKKSGIINYNVTKYDDNSNHVNYLLMDKNKESMNLELKKIKYKRVTEASIEELEKYNKDPPIMMPGDKLEIHLLMEEGDEKTGDELINDLSILDKFSFML